MSEAAQVLAGPQRWIATGKDLLALLRDLVLVLLFLMLLIGPGFIGERLSRAGFEQGSLMGFTWKNRAKSFGAETIELKRALEVANQKLLAQAAFLKGMEAELASLRATSTDPQQSRRIDALVSQNRKAVQQSIQTSIGLAEQLSASQPVAAQAREALGTSQKWAVVLGADRTIEQAQHESRSAILRGIPSVGLYQRRGAIRTVALAETKQAAEALLPKARLRNKDAYVVDFDKWCPKRETQDKLTVCVEQ